MNSTTPVLDLLRDPAHWTKGAWARDKDKYACSVTHPDAVCFCIRGAMIKCYPDIKVREKIYSTKLKPLVPYPWSDWMAFNDYDLTTHEDILRILEAAQI